MSRVGNIEKVVPHGHCDEFRGTVRLRLEPIAQKIKVAVVVNIAPKVSTSDTVNLLHEGVEYGSGK